MKNEPTHPNRCGRVPTDVEKRLLDEIARLERALAEKREMLDAVNKLGPDTVAKLVEYITPAKRSEVAR